MDRISKLIFPRPTVLITTCDKQGKPNVAAFSFITPVSFNPKYVSFAVAPERHTFRNLLECREFVVNVPSEGLLSKVWICGSESGRDVDKFKLAGLEVEGGSKVRPPRIKNCPIQLECVVEFMKEFGDHYLVVGKVVEEHVEKLDLRPILHYTGREFYKLGEKVKYQG